MVGVDVEMRHVRYLLAVAEHANFTRAAEALHVSQPTLSQQIKQLERSLRVQLLDRSGRTVRLTDAGETYARYARRALQDLAAGERAMRDVQDLTAGALRLATTPTLSAYLIGPLVEDFHARYPGITLDIRETTQDRIEARLLDDTLDLGIAFAGPHLSAVSSTAMYVETLGLVVGSGHPDAGRTEPLPIHELRTHELALLSSDFVTRRHIDDHFAAHHIEPRVVVEANSINALIEIVMRSTLATVLPDAITLERPGLHTIPLVPEVPARTIVLLRRDSAYLSAAARAFIRITENWAHTRDPAPGVSSRRPTGPRAT
jgi:LysR family cyn operon transcriptional activator